MTRSIWKLAAVPLTLCLSLAAQDGVQHAPDGGTMERIQSVVIPTIPNAPFSATVVTELTHILPDGSRQTTWNHRTVARDSAGVVFQERRYFSPHGDTQATPVSEYDYQDPNLHEAIRCYPSSRTCRTFRFLGVPAAAAQEPMLPLSTRMANGTTITREDLGRNMVEGVECLGSREIMTIPAGLIGNEKAQPVVKEFWYSPQLHINVVTKRFDPRVSSVQNFTVTKLTQSEPDPTTFDLPVGYRMIREVVE